MFVPVVVVAFVAAVDGPEVTVVLVPLVPVVLGPLVTVVLGPLVTVVLGPARATWNSTTQNTDKIFKSTILLELILSFN